jgi:7-cyano-7-deazaguanine synthase
MKRAIALLSGGIDSALTTQKARASCEELYVLHMSYGQKTWRKERYCAEDIAKWYNAKEFKVVDVNFFKEIGKSSLVDWGMEVPKYVLPDSSTIPNTYVPFRNGNIASIATAWAEAIEAQSIWIGTNALDYSGYVDCRPEFWVAFNRLLLVGTIHKPQVVTPIINMSKVDIIKDAIGSGVPVERTWSCYIEEWKACGVCESCILRRKAFLDAGFSDPIPYANTEEEFLSMIGGKHEKDSFGDGNGDVHLSSSSSPGCDEG